MNKNNFAEELELLGIDITSRQLEQFEQYYKLLTEWNKKINLTAIVEEEQVYLKHFYDSATIIKAIDLNKIENLCDVGTGAGFPGIVIKILFPNIDVTLVDSLNKRVLFLNEVIKKLELIDIVAIHSRAEDYAKKNREKFDVVTARAVAHLKILTEYCIPLVKVGKYFIPLKGNISQEITESSRIIETLFCKIEREINFFLPLENSVRTILLIKKTKETPIKYPREIKIINSGK